VRRGPDELAERVASTGASAFLPDRLADRAPEHLPAAGAISVADVLDLGRGRWLLVLQVAEALLASAVVEEGEGFRRASVGDGVAEALIALTAAGGGRASFSFRRLGEIGPWTGERAIDVDQSNESVVVGERAVVKRWIWMAPDNRRPIVLPEHLVASEFTEMPVPLGHAVWHHGAGVAPIASVATYLPDARDGWDWYVDLVDRSIDDPSLDAVEPAAALGALTARLHVSLATPTGILPAPSAAANEGEVAGWRRDAERDLEAALTSIDGEEGKRLHEQERAIRAALSRLPLRGTTTIPIHGDLHVGQFLRWRDGLAISDLDGDPLGRGGLSGPAAKDVAGLLQSLDHVGRIVERRRHRSVAPWIDDATGGCLRSYRAELADRGASSLFDEELLGPFRVAQELHEFVYAASYLPGWRYVPDRAIAALLGTDE
jgi:maltokinase